jgi:hypothetical protein
MGYCSICKRDHEGTACHNDDKPIYNEAMDVIAELKKKLAEKEAELAAAKEENDGWELSFHLFDDAIRRGTYIYLKAHPGMKNELPSHDKLIPWLLEELAATREALTKISKMTAVEADDVKHYQSYLFTEAREIASKALKEAE